MTVARIRRSTLAGTWYPDGAALGPAIAALVKRVGAEPDPTVVAGIVPHAGYRDSGRTAAAFYARIPRGRWRRAVVLAPAHGGGFAGAAVATAAAFETPLGVVKVDREAADALTTRPGFEVRESAYDGEHSLEIQLPFLQAADERLRVVPVLIGGRVPSACLESIADGLRSLDDGDTLWIVSSDFTHYGDGFGFAPFPPGPDLAERLRDFDSGVLAPICAGSVLAFESVLARTGATVCGQGPIDVLLRLFGSSLRGEVVSYGTSFDLTGDRHRSVSYASIAFRGDPLS